MFNRGETEIQKFSGQKAKSNQDQKKKKPRQNKTPFCDTLYDEEMV